MDIGAIIRELRKELERIDRLIVALDTLHTGPRRGRPPKLLQQLREASEASKTPAKKSVKKNQEESQETLLKNYQRIAQSAGHFLVPKLFASAHFSNSYGG